MTQVIFNHDWLHQLSESDRSEVQDWITAQGIDINVTRAVVWDAGFWASNGYVRDEGGRIMPGQYTRKEFVPATKTIPASMLDTINAS